MLINKTMDVMPAKIVVVGCGGGGNNAVNRMVEAGIKSATFIAINTDLQDLNRSKANIRIQIGDKLTHGQGAGADPEKGQKAAEESKDAITKAIHDADLVFITAGMGGGTGTGSAPVVASIAKEMGKLTVAVVTKPFPFEGKPRMDNAEIGIANLRKVVDTLVVIPNAKLMMVASRIPILDAFRHADDVLRQGIQGITDPIVTPALINLDFADVCTVMRNSGLAHMGIGSGKGEKRTVDAVKQAVFSPLLETSIEGASRIILNIMGSLDVTLEEINEATELVREVVMPGANIIFGADIRDTMEEEIIVTVIATGFADENQRKANMNNRPVEQQQIRSAFGATYPTPQQQAQRSQQQPYVQPYQQQQQNQPYGQPYQQQPYQRPQQPFNPQQGQQHFGQQSGQPYQQQPQNQHYGQQYQQQPYQRPQQRPEVDQVESSRVRVDDDFPAFLQKMKNRNNNQ